MPKHTDNDAWKPKATDIAYKDPFSDSTARTRKLLVVWASIALLNHFYPVDLENSHVLGLRFAQGTAPPIGALLGFVVMYLAITFSVYVYQEIQSWLAQANEVALRDFRNTLQNIYAHHTTISVSVSSATQQLTNYTDSLSKFTATVQRTEQLIPKALSDNFMEMNAHTNTFHNVCRNLGEANEKYGAEVEAAKQLLAVASSGYAKARVSQLIKVGFLEVAIPCVLGLAAVFATYNDVSQIIKKIAL